MADIEFTPSLISPRFAAAASPPIPLNEMAAGERLQVLEKMHGGDYRAEARPCRLCDGRTFRVLAEQDRYAFPVRTVICNHCALVQTNPDFRHGDYVDFYRRHYRRLYIADLVGEPGDFFQEEFWRGQQIHDFVRRHARFGRAPFVLEVGCGAGGILHAFRERGFEVMGTDYGAENLAYGRARGIDIREGDLFSLQLDRRPDLILYSHVLEHVYDPNRELARVHELLAPDGYLYVEVPGVKATRTNVFQGDFLQMFHLAHIYNFTLATLSSLLAKNGFALIGGNEEIRSIYRRAAPAAVVAGNAAEIIDFMKSTESHRKWYRAAFRARVRVLAVGQQLRARGVGLLKRLGLYAIARRWLAS